MLEELRAVLRSSFREGQAHHFAARQSEWLAPSRKVDGRAMCRKFFSFTAEPGSGYHPLHGSLHIQQTFGNRHRCHFSFMRDRKCCVSGAVGRHIYVRDVRGDA